MMIKLKMSIFFYTYLLKLLLLLFNQLLLPLRQHISNNESRNNYDWG